MIFDSHFETDKFCISIIRVGINIPASWKLWILTDLFVKTIKILCLLLEFSMSTGLKPPWMEIKFLSCFVEGIKHFANTLCSVLENFLQYLFTENKIYMVHFKELLHSSAVVKHTKCYLKYTGKGLASSLNL